MDRRPLCAAKHRQTDGARASVRCLLGTRGFLIGRRFGAAAVAAFALATACTTTKPTIEAPAPPSVTVLSARIVGVSEGKASLSLTLGLSNPNDFDLPVDALACEVTLDSRPAANVQSVHVEPLPAHGNAKVDLAGRVDIVVVATSLMALGSEVPVAYTLKGTVTLRNGITLPFSRKGDIPVARFDRALGVHP